MNLGGRQDIVMKTQRSKNHFGVRGVDRETLYTLTVNYCTLYSLVLLGFQYKLQFTFAWVS